MTKLNLLLLAALVISALVLVKTSYEARRLFSALDGARSESTRLAVEHKRLDSERQAQATHWRVEKVARERLAMRVASPAVTRYLSLNADAATGGASAPAPGAASGVGR